MYFLIEFFFLIIERFFHQKKLNDEYTCNGNYAEAKHNIYADTLQCLGSVFGYGIYRAVILTDFKLGKRMFEYH